MRILIIGKVERRDFAQVDMYKLIAKKHELYFCSGEDAFHYINKVDLVWLGIYHQWVDIDWPFLFAQCNVPVIIDNADNEEFFANREKLPYQLLYKKVFTSRYLPNESMEKIETYYGTPVMQLTWYVNPQRMMQNDDNIDFAFIAKKDKRREKLMRDAETIAKAQKWSYAIGEYFGQEYLYLLSKTKVFYCDCERKCLTQKYIEAALSGCRLIGDVPIYPMNTLGIIPAGINNLVSAYNEALKSKPQKWDSPFLSDFNKVIKQLDANLLV